MATPDYVWNPRFEAFGKKHMRWVEQPDKAGLRPLGYADEFSQFINHRGWYFDDYDERFRGVIYRMTAKHGHERFVVGFDDPWNDGPVCLSFDEVFEDFVCAAIHADRLAKLAAAKCREDKVEDFS